MTREAPDHLERVAGATTFDRNLVVVAGAGSGKTTLLIERLLNLLLGRGTRLSEIVALTFTEKAAAEMRERLATQLSRAIEILDGLGTSGAAGVTTTSEAATRSLAWVLRAVAEGGAGVDVTTARQRALDAMTELDGGSLGTIHAYCADLLRRHPGPARLDPAFSVDDGSRATRVLDDEWTRFQAETLAAGVPHEADWRRVLERLDASIVRDAAAALVREGITSAGARDAAAWLGARVQAARAALADAASRATNRNAGDWARSVDGVLAAFEDGGSEAAGAALAEAALQKTVPSPGKGCADAESVSAAFKDAARLAKAIAALDEALCDALLGLGLDLAARVRERLAFEGIATFQGLLIGARDLLLSSLAVRREEQHRVAAFLLDEFQDTDPLQYELAFLLGEDPETPVPEGGDPWTAQLLPGRLFIVGDPKQSIYRFRGADMAAYDRAVGALAEQGARIVSLSANFRSRTEVLAPINLLCETLIREDRPYQPRYEALVAAREDRDAGEPRVAIWTVDGAPPAADERRLAEARVIGRHLVDERRAGRLRTYGDVALLFRAMTSVGTYQRGLAEAGVPFVTQGGRGFVERDEIVQAVALLRALVKPNDASSLIAVLRSPSCGAGDDELRRFAELTHRQWRVGAHRLVPAERRAEVARVVRTLEGLDELRLRVRDLPADEAIRVALAEPSHRLNGADGGWHPHLAALHAASHGGAQRLANLEKLVLRAEDLARTESLSLARVVERLWTEMNEGSEQGESPLADEAVDAVRLMSIHQAKGLEFPVVFLPDLARGPSSGRKGTSVRIAAQGDLVAVTTRRGLRNAAALVLEDQDRRHEAAQDARLLHVALTRAKERLVLVNGDRHPDANAWPLAPIRAGWGYDPAADADAIAACLAPGIEHRLVGAAEPEAESAGPTPVEDLSGAVRAQDEAAAVLEGARRPRPRSPSGVKEVREGDELELRYVETAAGVAISAERGDTVTDDAAAASPRPALDGALARAIGIAVHAALEVGALDDPRSLAALAPRAARIAAAETGEDPRAIESEAGRLLAALPGTQLAAALSGARVLARELPFLLEQDGQSWQGFIDLVIEKDGEVVVVDWKTDRTRDPSRHRAQLALYAEAVRRWRSLPRTPKTALAYVDGGAWVES